MSANSKYAEEFKIKVAKATLEDGATLKSTGEKFGVNPTLVRNWRIKYVEGTSSEGGYVNNQSEDDSNKEGGVKKLSDEVLQELFEEKEESLDDKATFATVVSEAGGNLYNVQLDVEFNEDGTWDFVARLCCEEIVLLPESARKFVEDKLEEIGDELYSDFEKFGLDPQMMGDYKVEVTDE